MITLTFQGPHLTKEQCWVREQVCLDYLRYFPEDMLREMIEDEKELFDLGSSRVEIGECAMSKLRDKLNSLVYNALGCDEWYNPEEAPTVDLITVS